MNTHIRHIRALPAILTLCNRKAQKNPDTTQGVRVSIPSLYLSGCYHNLIAHRLVRVRSGYETPVKV